MAQDSTATGVRLTNSEAIPLAYALCARLADDLGIRIIAIKGPVLAHHGLRDPRVSADIDMLVHPDDMPAFRAAMNDAGWFTAPESEVPKLLTHHSVNLLNEHWPIGLDLHVYFPGFLAPAEEVFEELWRRRDHLTFAGHEVWVTDRASSAAIAALHYLRSVYRPTNASALARLVEKSRTVFADREAAADLLVCAQSTGSVRTLGPYLDQLGLDTVPVHPAEESEYAVWARGTTAHPHLAWWIEFRAMPPWKWPGFLWHGLMLRPDELRAYHGDRTTTTPLWRLRVRRWRRIAARLPGVVRHEIGRRRD